MLLSTCFEVQKKQGKTSSARPGTFEFSMRLSESSKNIGSLDWQSLNRLAILWETIIIDYAIFDKQLVIIFIVKIYTAAYFVGAFLL